MTTTLDGHFTCKRILRHALPNIGTVLAITSFQMVDGCFVANCLGVQPFAAVSLVLPFFMILCSPGCISSGSHSACAGNWEESAITEFRKWWMPSRRTSSKH